MAGRYPYLHAWQRENSIDYAITKEALIALELESLAKRNVLALSGGERRRAAIAAVLAQTPEIYLLDEPLNQLDPKYQIQVLNYFRALVETKNNTVVMALHDVNLATRFCSHVIMLFDDGNYLVGSMNELLQQTNLEKLYGQKMQAIDTELGRMWFY